MKNIVCLVSFLSLSLFSLFANAQLEPTFTIRKIVGSDLSTTFYSCQNQTCTVLGGGSFTQEETYQLSHRLKMIHYLKTAGIGAFIAAGMVLNPMSILFVALAPAPTLGVMVLIGSAGSGLIHKKLPSYIEYAVVQNEDVGKIDAKLRENIEKNFDNFRKYLNQMKQVDDNNQNEILEPLSIHFP